MTLEFFLKLWQEMVCHCGSHLHKLTMMILIQSHLFHRDFIQIKRGCMLNHFEKYNQQLFTE